MAYDLGDSARGRARRECQVLAKGTFSVDRARVDRSLMSSCCTLRCRPPSLLRSVRSAFPVRAVQSENIDSVRYRAGPKTNSVDMISKLRDTGVNIGQSIALYASVVATILTKCIFFQ